MRIAHARPSVRPTLLPSALVLALLPGCRAPAPDGSETASRGARPVSRERALWLYREACAPCHGRDGDGRGRYAAELATAPTDFTGGVFIWSDASDPDDIATLVADGLPDSPMPAWEKLLAPSDRRAVAEVVVRFAR